MARYNRWQNRNLLTVAETLDPAAREAGQGAFWDSIAGTLSHLLWGDLVWLARFAGDERPAGPLADSGGAFADWGAWRRARLGTDARILDWARGLAPADLEGDLFWFSGTAGRMVSRPMALCVTHFFNHQTHHRGQVHALLTRAGGQPGDTDLFLMPVEVDWM